MSLLSNVAPITRLGLTEEAQVGHHRSQNSGVRIKTSPSSQLPGNERAFAAPRSAVKTVLDADSSLKVKTAGAVSKSQSYGRSEIGDARRLGNVVSGARYNLQTTQPTIVSDCASTLSGAGGLREDQQQTQQQLRHQHHQPKHEHQQHQSWHDSSPTQRQITRECGGDASGRAASGAGVSALPRLMDWACTDSYMNNGFPWQSNHGSSGSILPPPISSAPLLSQAREKAHVWGDRSGIEEDGDACGGGDEIIQNSAPLPSLNHVSGHGQDNNDLELHQRQPDNCFAQQHQSIAQWQSPQSSTGMLFWPVEGGGGSESSKETSRPDSQSSFRPESDFDFSELGYLLCEDGQPSSPIRLLPVDANGLDPPRIL